MIDNSQGAFMCRSSTLTILAILARFMHYYSSFWGLKAIYTIDDLRGAFVSPSSTLAILADSGPFDALLLTVLGY